MDETRESKLAKTNFWDELLRLRDEQRADRASAIQVVRGNALPQEVNRQGLMRGISIVQHVNEDPDKPAKFVAAEPNLFACTSVDRGSGFEQIDDAPEYRHRATERRTIQ